MDGVFSKFREIADKVTNVVMNYTVVESKVREATNDEPWGPTGAAMQELARYTYNYEHYGEVMTTVWKRMLFDNKNQWRRVSKSLTLLGYLVRHGSERVVSSARDHMYDMKLLETYQCSDEHGRDQGAVVRQKVKDLLDFIEDDERVRSERKHAKKVKEKMTGISGEGYSSRRHYSDQYDDVPHHNEDPDWQRGERGDDAYEEDYQRHDQRHPRRDQRHSDYKDDDNEDDDESSRDSRSRTETRDARVQQSRQKTTQNAKGAPKFPKKFGDFQMNKKTEEDEFDPRAEEKGDGGQDDGYGDFLDYRSKPTPGGGTGAGDLLDFDLLASAPVVSSTHPSAVLPPAPLSPKSSGTVGVQPTLMGAQPIMVGVQPSMTGVQQGMMGGQPNLMGGQPNMMGGQPNLMGNQPNMMGVQPNLMGGQPNLMGFQPNMMGIQPRMMGVQPSMMGIQQQSMMGFYQPSIMGNQQPSMTGLYSAPGGMHRPISAGGVSAQGNFGFHQQSGSLL